MAKPGKRKKRQPTTVRNCAFCPSFIELFKWLWEDVNREFAEAGWTVIPTVRPRHPKDGFFACPACSDRLGPGPIDHEIRGVV